MPYHSAGIPGGLIMNLNLVSLLALYAIFLFLAYITDTIRRKFIFGGSTPALALTLWLSEYWNPGLSARPLCQVGK